MAMSQLSTDTAGQAPTIPTSRGVLFAPVVTRDLPQALRFTASLYGSRAVGGVIAEALTRALAMKPDRIRTADVGRVNR